MPSMTPSHQQGRVESLETSSTSALDGSRVQAKECKNGGNFSQNVENPKNMLEEDLRHLIDPLFFFCTPPENVFERCLPIENAGFGNALHCTALPFINSIPAPTTNQMSPIPLEDVFIDLKMHSLFAHLHPCPKNGTIKMKMVMTRIFYW